MSGKIIFMKIAFPVQDDQGAESMVYTHSGSARFFIMIETANTRVETIINKDKHHQHGQCQPLGALGGRQPDAIVVGGIGVGALQKLQSAGIKVYRAVEGTVQENLELIKSERLPEFTLDQTCAGHSMQGECVH